jgi:non-homologous end joining protein Ku
VEPGTRAATRCVRGGGEGGATHDAAGSARGASRPRYRAIDQGAAPKIRDQERTLAERLISELSATEFQPENDEDEYRKRLQKAIEQKIAGQDIQRVEVEARAPTTDLVATLKASLERKGLAKAEHTGAGEKTPAVERKRRRAS